MHPINDQTQIALYQKVRQLRVRALFKTLNGDFTLSDKDFVAGSISHQSSCLSGDGFELGACIASSFSCSLTNADDRWTSIPLEGASIMPEIGIITADDQTSWIPLGTFIVDQPGRPYSILQIKASDRLVLLDEPLSACGITYPATHMAILQKISSRCNVPLASSVAGALNITHNVPSAPDNNMSCRDAVSEIALMAGGFARMTRLGELEIVPFRKPQLVSHNKSTWGELRGGAETWGEQRTAGKTWGSLTPWRNPETWGASKTVRKTWGQVKSKLAVWGLAKTYGLKDLKEDGIWVMPSGSRYSFQELTDAVTITGMKYKNQVWGTGGYVVDMRSLELLPDTHIPGVLNAVWGAIQGITYTAYKAEYPGNPAIDCGDAILHKTANGKSILTYVTSHTYNHGGKSSLSASAKPKRTQGYKSANERRLAGIAASVENTKEELNSYQLETAQMSDTMSRALGVYQTVEKQADGSAITYLHSSDTLATSKERWKLSKNPSGTPSMTYSSDYGQTWSGGILGDKLIMRAIVAQSITSEMIQAGAISADKVAAKSLTSQQINTNELLGINAKFSGTVEAATIKTSSILMWDGSNYFSVGTNGAAVSTNMIANSMRANDIAAFGGYMQNISASNFNFGSGSISSGVNIGSSMFVSQTGIRLNCGGKIAVFENTGNAWLGIYAGDPDYAANVIWAVTQNGQVYTSDRRLKENIQPIAGDRILDFLSRFSISGWDWKRDGSHGIGVIADDIEEALDEELSEQIVSDVNGVKAVKYDLLATLAVGAIPELMKQIADLKSEVNSLRSEVERMKHNGK